MRSPGGIPGQPGPRARGRSTEGRPADQEDSSSLTTTRSVPPAPAATPGKPAGATPSRPVPWEPPKAGQIMSRALRAREKQSKATVDPWRTWAEREELKGRETTALLARGRPPRGSKTLLCLRAPGAQLANSPALPMEKGRTGGTRRRTPPPGRL